MWGGVAITVCGLIIVILLLLVYSIVITHNERKKYYTYAIQQSLKINKPLLVIGDPSKGQTCSLFGAPYGFGTVCIDIDPISEQCIKADALNYLRLLPDDSCVCFISCVLEYVDDLDEIIRELYRVTGNYKNLFVVHVKWYALTAYVYSFQNDSAKHVITEAPPNSSKIKYYNV